MGSQSTFSGSDIKRAIETRDSAALAGFYADDAVITIIDRYNPPSKPRELAGAKVIAAYWDDVCARDMTHVVDIAASEGDRIAFTENCAYPDGTKVFCAAVLELGPGGITKQKTIQAWDE